MSYEYELVHQDRKTLSLTVRPDLSMLVKCPTATSDERLEQFLQRKWWWLEKQRTFFRKYQQKTYKKEYTSGESHYYLGKQYRLIVRQSAESKVTLQRGKLLVETTGAVDNHHHNRTLLRHWYLAKVRTVFAERFTESCKRFDYDHIPNLRVKAMPKRWGSFISQKVIALNPRLICTPKACIDYVIVHELCHVQYRGHTKKFYDLLESKYPSWQKAKDRLEQLGQEIGDHFS